LRHWAKPAAQFDIDVKALKAMHKHDRQQIAAASNTLRWIKV
jgi:hypothetical protein